MNATEGFSIVFVFFTGFFGALIAEMLQSTSKTIQPVYKHPRLWLQACVGGGLALMLGASTPVFGLFIGFSSQLMFRSLLRPATRQAELEAVEKVEQAERAVKEEPDKARPYWDLSSARLELYFQRNLSQTKSIFWITVMVLLAGFGLICYGVWKSFDGGKIEAAVLTTASGVLTEFIAATFLVIYKSTLSQASSFVQALKKINAVGMALQVVDSIAESSSALRDKTRADLAIKILDTFPPPGVSSAQKKKARVQPV